MNMSAIMTYALGLIKTDTLNGPFFLVSGEGPMGGPVRGDDQKLAPLDAFCCKAKPRGLPQIVASKPGIKV
jgi:hypothetical protein